MENDVFDLEATKRRTRETPLDLDLEHLCFTDKGILIDRSDCGGMFLAVMVDKRDYPREGEYRWWVFTEFIPVNWPPVSVYLNYMTNRQVVENINEWLPGPDAILADYYGLFDEQGEADE